MKFRRFPEIEKIFLGPKGRNVFLLFPIIIINFIAATFEGVSFSFVLFALEAMGSTSTYSFQQGPLRYIPWLDHFASLPSSKVFIFFFVGAVCLQIVRSCLNFISQLGFVYMGLGIQLKAEEKVYRQIFAFSFPYVSKFKAGDLLEYGKISSNLMPSLVDVVNRITVSFFAVAGLVTMMTILSWKITILAGFLFGFLGFLQKKTLKMISQTAQKFTSVFVNFTKALVENLQGLRAIHTFHQQTKVVRKIRKSLIEIVRVSGKLQFWNHITTPVSEIGGIVLVGLFLVIGQRLIGGNQEQTLSILLTFVMMCYRLSTRLQNLMGGVAGIAGKWGDIVRLQSILEAKGKEFIPKTGKEFSRFNQSICFKGVSLQYPESSSFALKEISLDIPAGSVVAIVGTSGSGKSSLIDLILRLYEPTEGSIEIDGALLQKFEIGSYRKHLGVVSQDVFVFQDTIEQNIRFGALGISLDRVKAAAKLAHAHHFIEKLPQGYNTVIGENGHSLSGGERQRISLARALVRDPEILILDEATSSLDSESEKIIQEALETLQGKKTMIIIAHKLSSIQHADQIVVLEHGRIIEKGTHKELLDQNGRYAFLWQIQAQKISKELFRELLADQQGESSVTLDKEPIGLIQNNLSKK